MRAALENVRKETKAGKIPEGLAMARRHAEMLGLSKYIDFCIGLSPDDVASVVAGRKLEYVLIDGGHCGDQPLKDWLAVKPFLADSCVVVFHDCHPVAEPVRRALANAEIELGTAAVHLPTRCALSIVCRDVRPETVPALQALCIRNRPLTFAEIAQQMNCKLQRKVKRLGGKIKKLFVSA